MVLFKYLKQEMATLLDKQTWDTTTKFKYRHVFYGQFGANPPNKIANISG